MHTYMYRCTMLCGSMHYRMYMYIHGYIHVQCTYLVLWLTLVFLISLNSTSQRRKTVRHHRTYIDEGIHQCTCACTLHMYMYMYLSPGLPRHTSCSWAYCCRTVISMPLRMPDFLNNTQETQGQAQAQSLREKECMHGTCTCTCMCAICNLAWMSSKFRGCVTGRARGS